MGRTLQTNIGGYTVEMVNNDDRDGMNCFVSKGAFSASLSKLDDSGTLDDHNDNEMNVPEDIIHRIGVWAEARGY